MAKAKKKPAPKIDLSVFPKQRQLHIVLHGLISVRMSACIGTVTLNVPNIAMGSMHHIYRVGTYCDPLFLPVGHDFHLEGVEAGTFNADPNAMADEFLTLSMADIQASEPLCKFSPHGTRTTVQLPWPNDVKRVRILKVGPDPLYTFAGGTRTVNPHNLGYITYLTYELDSVDHPVLYKGSEKFWCSDALRAHTRLHFFADPPEMMSNATFIKHVRIAYDEAGDQLFQPALDLVPGTKPRPQWSDPDPSCGDIPPTEQQDLTQPPCPSYRRPRLGDVGNCLGFFILD